MPNTLPRNPNAVTSGTPSGVLRPTGTSTVRVRRPASYLPTSRSTRGVAPAPVRGGGTPTSRSVRVSARWQGSGPAHWHCGPVRTTHTAPVATATNLAAVRKRGMYGY